MPNPFQQMQMQQQMQANPQINSMKQAYNLFKNGNNPMQLLNNMAMQNPQLKPVVQMLQNGANPEQVFRQMCQQQGIDANQFIKMFTQQ